MKMTSWQDDKMRVDDLTLSPLDLVILSNLVKCDDLAEIDPLFDAARARGNEGLMVKDPASFYKPGRRGRESVLPPQLVVAGRTVVEGKLRPGKLLVPLRWIVSLTILKTSPLPSHNLQCCVWSSLVSSSN